MTAFRATYSDWKLVKTRGVVQVVMEVPVGESDAAYEILGGMPVHGKERWFGIAAIKSPEEKEDRAKPRQSNPPSPHPDGAARQKMDWREVQPAAQAAMQCDKPVFWAFLNETRGYGIDDPTGAAEAVREICSVQSRSELGTNHKARVLWKQLDDEFSAWKALEHA
jgi:hypothetical protein